MKKAIGAAALVLSCIGAAQAADEGKHTTFGAPDCGQWLKQNRVTDRSWLLGYVTALNATHAWLRDGEDPLGKISSAQQIFAWMDNYCRAHPLEPVSRGAFDLIAELTAKLKK